MGRKEMRTCTLSWCDDLYWENCHSIWWLQRIFMQRAQELFLPINRIKEGTGREDVVCITVSHNLVELIIIIGRQTFFLPSVLQPWVALDLLREFPPLLPWLCINSQISAPKPVGRPLTCCTVSTLVCLSLYLHFSAFFWIFFAGE